MSSKPQRDARPNGSHRVTAQKSFRTPPAYLPEQSGSSHESTTSPLPYQLTPEASSKVPTRETLCHTPGSSTCCAPSNNATLSGTTASPTTPSPSPPTSVE